MIKIHKETPDNFIDIQKYLIEEDYLELFIKAKHYFFYDTCSIVTHSNSVNRKKIGDYILSKKGIVILTKTVLMELQNNNNIIEEEQVNYIKDLFEKGISIVLLNEEDIYYILNELISININDLNKILGVAINEISKLKGTVYEIKVNDPQKLSNKMMDNRNKVQYYTDFFKFARSMKKSKDNLAEELMFICFIVLSRVPILGKIVFLSNDLKSRGSVLSINKFTSDKHLKREPYQLTSAALVFTLYQMGLIKTKEDIIEFFDKTNTGNIPVYYIGEYDIDLQYKSFTKEQLVNNIMLQKEFKIIY